jgi:hypothetical protein
MTRAILGSRGRRAALAAVVLVAVVTAAAAPGGVVAAGAKTVRIPATVVFRTAEFPAPNDPRRCVAFALAQYPGVPKATSYSVLVRGFRGSSNVTGGGPPFSQDVYPVTLGRKKVVLRAPAGKHWFVLGSSSTGQGCKASLAGLKNRFKIARATATVG